MSNSIVWGTCFIFGGCWKCGGVLIKEEKDEYRCLICGVIYYQKTLLKEIEADGKRYHGHIRSRGKFKGQIWS